MVRLIKGDLIVMTLQGEFDYIIHGCNCRNIMGAGIALQIATNFPEALKADTFKFSYVESETELLGDYSVGTVKRNNKLFSIINLYTQFDPGANFRLSALSNGLFKLAKLIPKQARIGLPKIGAGIGGGNWNEIIEVIRIEMANHDCTIVEYEKVKL